MRLGHSFAPTARERLGERRWLRLKLLAGRGPAPGPRGLRELPHRGRALGWVRALPRQFRPIDLTDWAAHFRTDKWGGHWYTPHYERHLVHLRRERFTLLEIGIGGYDVPGSGGESLRMWKHFFPRAQIVGVDIDDKSFLAQDRIRVYHGSQTDDALMRRIVAEAERLMVVIDDGSHQPAHVRQTFATVFPLLPNGAIYVIEDLQTSYWPNWGGSLDRADPATSMALVKDLIDGLNAEEFIDGGSAVTPFDGSVRAVHCYHNLVFIEKGDNREGHLREAAALRMTAAGGVDLDADPGSVRSA